MADAQSSGISCGFEVGDRVKRSSGTGCIGIVKSISEETANNGAEKKEAQNLLVNVLWDNGTQSYFSPLGLAKVKG